MIEITDPTDIRVQEFLTLRNKETGDYILCDSEKVVSKLFTTQLSIEKIFITSDYYATNKELLENKIDSNKIFVAQKSVIEDVVGYKLHHGVMAKAQAPKPTALDSLGDRIIVLNGITSPENVGSIIRSATAFGIDSIIYDHKSASPLLRRSIRVSMGNIFFSRFFRSNDLVADLEFISNCGYQVIGTANEKDSIALSHFNFAKKTALIVGSEGWGMDTEVRKCCSKTLKIPMNEDVAHLNAAVAASIFLYHLRY